MRTALHVVPKSASPHAAEPPASASRDALAAAGRALRQRVARGAHAKWKPSPSRRDPVGSLIQVTRGLLPDLLRIRFGRMLHSPFTFFRGAAGIMAADLARTRATGVRVQACGDCHLLNFGGFATPERRLIFDINDFDETLPAPWEWDVKRLATSIVLAARDKQFGSRQAREAATAAVRAYRKWTARYAAMPVLDAWYAAIHVRALVGEETHDAKLLAFRRRQVEKELHHTAADVDYPKLVRGGRHGPRIKDAPPLVYHLPDRPAFRAHMRRMLESYRDSLPEERRVLLDRYELADQAFKVVGVGSVGTFCGIALFVAGGEDPLFLQIKQARASVLEPYAGRSAVATHGQRVVVGQRIMQSASDVFLGWATDHAGQHFYVRQLRDVKIKPRLELFDRRALVDYARACGHALARAHARSGRSAMVAGYMGTGTKFDDAVAKFALAYADQTERDHGTLVAAVRTGRVEATIES